MNFKNPVKQVGNKRLNIDSNIINGSEIVPKKRKINDISQDFTINNKFYHINGKMLLSGRYENKQILIIGKSLGVVKNNKWIHEFESTDGINFIVKLNYIKRWTGYSTEYIEIRGHVCRNYIIEQHSYEELGNEFNAHLWNECLIRMMKYYNLF